jgi:hypothetical protein
MAARLRAVVSWVKDTRLRAHATPVEATQAGAGSVVANASRGLSCGLTAAKKQVAALRASCPSLRLPRRLPTTRLPATSLPAIKAAMRKALPVSLVAALRSAGLIATGGLSVALGLIASIRGRHAHQQRHGLAPNGGGGSFQVGRVEPPVFHISADEARSYGAH